MNQSTQSNLVQKPQPINTIMNVVCVIIIAFGVNDLLFGSEKIGGLVNIMAGILLMPNVINWDFRSANKYQKVFLIGVATLNIGFIGYLIFRYLVKI
jgi:uncharacterized protein involved in response to NO